MDITVNATTFTQLSCQCIAQKYHTWYKYPWMGIPVLFDPFLMNSTVESILMKRYQHIAS